MEHVRDRSLPPLPAAPGVIVDAVEAGRCFEASTFSKVIILDDGSLWQWRRTFSWVNPFVWVTGTVLGLLLGLAAGFFLVKLNRALRDP